MPAWKKHGLIFNSNRNFDWSRSHAQVPVIDNELEKCWRIYYSSRNDQGQSNISFIEVEKGNPKNILYSHTKTILDFGINGTFDDCGLMPTCIITINNLKYLYYIGWTIKQTVPYQNSIGLAISKDNGKTFHKKYLGPILGVDKFDPYFTGTFFVFKENDNYLGYYLSCIDWKSINGRMEPFYDIKLATSKDGINWIKSGTTAINLIEGEGGIASASIIKEDNRYKMWYSVRAGTDYRKNKNNSYKIGYAESDDGKVWSRMTNEETIKTSLEGWDSEMVAYPYVIKYNNKLFAFYNGNGFGKTGFGYATKELN